MIEGKVWGKTVCVVETDYFSIHYLRILAGGFCSEHVHRAKMNRFFVIKGRLEIMIWQPSGVIDTIILKEGESTDVPAGVFHRFKAVEETDCIEIYQVSIDRWDIIRRSTGGID